jgi:hypothetical protein
MATSMMLTTWLKGGSRRRIWPGRNWQYASSTRRRNRKRRLTQRNRKRKKKKKKETRAEIFEAGPKDLVASF